MDDRIVELEVKLAFAAQATSDLSDALIDKERRITTLEERVARLERAVQVLAQRNAAPAEEVLGAHPEDDPVPRSG